MQLTRFQSCTIRNHCVNSDKKLSCFNRMERIVRLVKLLDISRTIKKIIIGFVIKKIYARLKQDLN